MKLSKYTERLVLKAQRLKLYSKQSCHLCLVTDSGKEREIVTNENNTHDCVQ